MNFIVEFLLWLLEGGPFGYPIHKVDIFPVVFVVILFISITTLSEFGFKQLFSMVGYTLILNFIVILFGGVPYFWWAWGWNFAFIPVFNWWKPMMLIFTISLISMVFAYNHGYDEEMDKYLWNGLKGVPNRCLDWPCTKFSEHYSYTSRAWEATQREEAEKAAKKAARAAKKAARAQAQDPPATPPRSLPDFMYQPAK